MKKYSLLQFFTLFALLQSLIVSCKKQESVSVPEISVNHSAFNWYAFSDGGFVRVDNLSSVPTVPAKPWTESVRISSILSAAPADDEKMPQAFAIVNRCGVLIFDGENAQLCPDANLFAERTAGNLVFYEDTPVFSVYRSSFFNEVDSNLSKNSASALHPFLVQFVPEQKISYPILTVESLGFDSDCEFTDFVWDGKIWTFCAKSSKHEKIDFSYITFQPKESLLSISPENAENSVFISECSVEKYRDAKKPASFKKAPERLKELFTSLPKDMNFSVQCYNAGGHSPRTYVNVRENANDIDDGGAKALFAYAVLSDTWSCVLFEDGTVFFKGALFGKYILNGSKTIGMKLPKLPSGFLYSGFAISGTNLFVAWEETSFYKTSRSGFINVDLDKVLYSGTGM